MIADRRGICLTCGIKTVEVKILSRTPITNSDVHDGICIRCNGSAVPASVLHEWQVRNNVHLCSPGNSPHTHRHRMRVAADAIRLATAGNVRQSSSLSEGQPWLTASATVMSNSSVHESSNNESCSISGEADDNCNGSLLHCNDPGASFSSATSQPASQRHRTQFGGSPGSCQQPSVLLSHSAHSASTHSQDGTTSLPTIGPLEENSSEPLEPEDYMEGLHENSFSLIKGMKENRNRPDILKQKLHGFRNLADDQAGALYEIVVIHWSIIRPVDGSSWWRLVRFGEFVPRVTTKNNRQITVVV
jgi:hypothetical protein